MYCVGSNQNLPCSYFIIILLLLLEYDMPLVIGGSVYAQSRHFIWFVYTVLWDVLAIRREEDKVFDLDCGFSGLFGSY